MFNNQFLEFFNSAHNVKRISHKRVSQLRILQLGAAVALSFLCSGHLFAMEFPTFSLKNNQWEQLVVPADTSNTSIRALFADDLPAEQYGVSWIIYPFDSLSNSYSVIGLDDTVQSGAGFWMIQNTGEDVTLDIPDNTPPIPSEGSSACAVSACSSIEIPAAADRSLFSMLGSGLTSNVMVSQLRVRTEQQGSACLNGCDLETAVESGYVSAPLWRWSNDRGSYIDLSEVGAISPWHAFWLNTPSNASGANASLLFPITEQAESFADYRITFDGTWSAGTHATRFPANPHFSGLVGAVHSDQVVFWEPGQIASDGVERMAETGGKSIFLQEIESAISSGYALSAIDGPGIVTSPGSASIVIRVTVDNPLVTLTTMLAPSPDWFAGFHNIRLYNGESFEQSVTIDGVLYDSGTDSGRRYTSRDIDTQPREPIARTTSNPADTPFIDGLPSVGRFTIEKL